MKSYILLLTAMLFFGCSSTSEKNSSVDKIRERAQEAYDELDVEIGK